MADEVVPSAPDEDYQAQAEASWAPAADSEDDVSAFRTPWWSRLLGLIFGDPGLDSARLERLDEAIARQPKAAVNYVLRGELYLHSGEPGLAAVDFEIALELETERFEREDWGVLSQVMRDQAERGLEQARRRLKKR